MCEFCFLLCDLLDKMMLIYLAGKLNIFWELA